MADKWFLVVFLIPCFHIVVGFHDGSCISLDGHSIGSMNFCDRCENDSRGGVGVFWTEKMRSVWGAVKKIPIAKNDFVGIVVTSIKVDGVELEGWYHIRILMSKKLTVYAFIFQIEDNVTNTAVGEFTTELLSACEGGNLTYVPTAAQILPCHGTSKYSPIVPNALVYWRGASVTDGTIRSNTPPLEFHVNWKVPPTSSCSPNRVFSLRLKYMSLNSTAALDSCKDLGVECLRPTMHEYDHYSLHLPQLNLSKGFHYPHPVPLFYDASKVDCHIPIYITDDMPYLFLEGTNSNPPGPPKAECVQGHGVVPPGEVFDPKLPKQPQRSLYLGRCTDEADGKAGADVGFTCTPALYPEDRAIINNLITVTKYIEDVRYDLCRCELPDSPVAGESPDGGSLTLTFGSGASPVPPPPLPPDYPVDDVISGPKPISVTNSETATKTPETPVQKIHRKVNDSRVLHALVSSFVFTFLIPISNFCARYMKESFYRDRSIIDRWYKIHQAGTGLTFVCFLVGQFVLFAGNFWNDLLEPVENLKGRIHGQIGWAVIGLYAFLMVTGGLRPYNPNSNRCLKITMGVHAILGFSFYYLGLIVMLIYLIDHFRLLFIIVSWIIIETLFHFIMTGLVICGNRQLNLGRSWFPVMELMFDHRNGPGKSIRNRLFQLYVVLSLAATGVTLFYIRPVVYGQASSMNRTLNKSADRSGIVYY